MEQKIKWNPKHNQVILKEIENSEQKHGRIVMPAKEDGGTLTCTVVAAGPGWVTINGNLIPISVRVGEIVIVSRIGPFSITIKGEKYISVKDTEILTGIEYE